LTLNRYLRFLIGLFILVAGLALLIGLVTAAPSGADPAPTPDVTPTPDPYAGLSVAELAARSYGGGELRVTQTLTVTSAFTRTLITYPSDGLKLYGFMNVPRGQGPFSVVLVLHGHVNTARYRVETYTTPYADALARAGYLVLHPNYRDHPPSDSGPSLFRVGYAVDVLNLIALVRQEGGKPGPLEQADPQSIGLLGHSMGGGIALRVITVSPDVRAAVLYGSMSGDEKLNYEQMRQWTGGTYGLEELDAPAEVFQRVSPINFLDRITAAVSIHHGEADQTVVAAWSSDLCGRLQALKKPVECFSYPGQPHSFKGAGDRLFIERVTALFDTHLRKR
jgi:dipeptidyl aminopeptidase/acylaminoacyl peptidase